MNLKIQNVVCLLLKVGVLFFLQTNANANANAIVVHNFAEAKVLLMNQVYIEPQFCETFYCKCKFDKNKTIDAEVCQYKVRKDQIRGKRLEWEHIVPASFFGNKMDCWQNGHASCRGKKGRKCCAKIDVNFKKMESDMHNLVPEIGELNADRANFNYGEVAGEARKYGVCDFEIDSSQNVAEPADFIRGDIARAYLYMNDQYGLGLPANEVTRFKEWHKKDPPSAWEKLRNTRIKNLQGNSNPYIDSSR